MAGGDEHHDDVAHNMKIKWIDESQGMSLKKFMSDQQRNQTKDVKENMFKGLIIVDIEPATVKHHRVWMDKADENSQYLETYDAMHKTTESEREAKGPITTSTYATEDDDIVGFSFCSQSSGSWKDRRLRLRCCV